MKLHWLALYSLLSKWPKGGYPLSPFVQLSLGTYSPESDGRILLSAQLMTPGEIDYVVDQLKAELTGFSRCSRARKRFLCKGWSIPEG
jgi:hypothetical protein